MKKVIRIDRMAFFFLYSTMNHLAHIFLSFDNAPILAGNLLGDFYKSKKVIDTLPHEIQNGIELHRHIDSFTDSHPIVFQSKARIREVFGKYAPVVIDVYYDYCLSKQWNQYSATDLQTSANFAYKSLLEHEEWLHPKLLKYLPVMIERNWLTSYQTVEGIQFAFDNLSKRAAYDKNFHLAGSVLVKNESDFLIDFDIFFPELINSTREKYDSMT